MNYLYIQDQALLDKWTGKMREAPRLTIDTEADSLHNYYEKVCLIQVSFGDNHLIIDPLARLDLKTFFSILAVKPLVLHTADYDLRMLKASFEFRPGREVFDVMIAAQLLGIEAFGLASLVERVCGIKLHKKDQKSDWSKRPLTEEQLQYASDDTRYLERLADTFAEELKALGRMDWLVESCERMVIATAQKNEKDPDDVWRIKGAGKLHRRELSYLYEIWHWREKEAQKADRPSFKILRGETMLEFAVWAAKNPNEDLSAGPKLPRDCVEARFNALKDALARARQSPETAWPKRPEFRPFTPTYDRAVFDKLSKAVAAKAAELKIAPHVLANRASLEAIALAKPKTAEELMRAGSLMRWQAGIIEALIA